MIVSSDQDFCHHLQLLASDGFSVMVIHNAPANSKQAQALEMHATCSYKRTDVIGEVIKDVRIDDDINQSLSIQKNSKTNETSFDGSRSHSRLANSTKHKCGSCCFSAS